MAEANRGADLPWTYGYTRRSFSVGGGAISWLELTDSLAQPGIPFVLVHGMQGSALEHCELGRQLAIMGPTYSLDLRAHGRSEASSDPGAGSMRDQINVVATFVREIVGRSVVLIGNSYGAMVAANTSRSEPDLVRALVLIGPAVKPSRNLIDPKRLLQLLAAKPQWVHDRVDGDVRSGKRREDADTLMASGTPYLDLIPATCMEALRAEPPAAWSVDNPVGRAALWRSRADAMRWLSRPRLFADLLNSLAPPAMWIHGRDDPIMPSATLEETQRALPYWQVHVIAATGHIPHIERPGWIAGCIQEWPPAGTSART